MRLYYVDQNYRDQMGPEEMKYPNKQLYSYNITNGDEIIVEPKKWTRWCQGQHGMQPTYLDSMWFFTSSSVDGSIGLRPQ